MGGVWAVRERGFRAPLMEYFLTSVDVVIMHYHIIKNVFGFMYSEVKKKKKTPKRGQPLYKG